MASTAEELSSQAEQLQAGISFFKGGEDGESRGRTAPKREPKGGPRPFETRLTRSRGGSYQATPQPAALKKAANSGLSLELGPEPMDSEFERF